MLHLIGHSQIRRDRNKSRTGVLSVTTLFCLCLAIPRITNADLVVSAEHVIAMPGDTGIVTVSVTNTGPALNLSGFQVEVLLGTFFPGDISVEFTSAVQTTIPPYVFGALGSGSVYIETIPPSVFPNTGFFLNDIVIHENPDVGNDYYVVIGTGETYGLGEIAFAVRPEAAYGIRSITFDNEEFVDEFFGFLGPVTFVPGSINVGNVVVNVVPEPASLLMLSLGGAIMLTTSAARRLRKRR